MTLEAWSENNLISSHQATHQEISDLLAVVETDLRDAAIPELSRERKVGCLYGAIPRPEPHSAPRAIASPRATAATITT